MTRRATVLAYHAVGECAHSDDPHRLYVHPEAFAAQMGFLARHRRVVALDDAMRGNVRRGKPPVVITFDDGYRSVLKNAVPILERHGFLATMFVPTQHIGDCNRWDPPYACPLDIMNRDELREAELRGLAIESHGHEHRRLARDDEATALADISTSVEILRDVTGRTPQFLAYPFGACSAVAQRAAANAGLRAAFTTNLPGRGPFAQPRITVTPYDGLGLFRLKTTGYYMPMRYSKTGARVTKPLRVLARRTRR